MRFQFDNNVCVILTPYRDNLGESWEESVICYPVLGQWELVVGFEVDEKKPVYEWAVDYLGHNQIAGPGVLDVGDWAAGYGHKLGTQTLSMLPDKGMYVERVWETLRANEAIDNAGEIVAEIGEAVSQLEYQLEDPTHEPARIENMTAELAALRDDLEKATANLDFVRRTRDALESKDPTFERLD